MNMLKDPAAGVPAQLLPHLHLLSKHRYPVTSNPSLETIVGYLLEAPKIVREVQPMQWQFIETPQDGTLMLTWQPLDVMATTFASDGYIWADAEHRFTSEVRGYTLEIFVQRSGYRAAGEAMASHSRKRYRLLPGNPSHGLPNPDPSLWLTHYSKASARDHVPAASIPISPFVQAQIQQRRLIQSQGQLPRKEFMLHDRSNWPVIHLPPGMARTGAPGQMPPGAGHRRGASVTGETTLEEEEDVSRGDLLDFMTPRDISRVRYEQHHEWMEEILESPYPTLSIIPSDLGLGRKGPLEELTKDFFDAPVSAVREPNSGPPPRVGKLPPGQVDEFTKRATKKLADMQEELEKMRKRHARRMQKIQQSTMLGVAEKKLRTAPNVTERRGSSNSKTHGFEEGSRDAVDEIVHSVETSTGMKVMSAKTVTTVSRGGLEERVKSTPVTATATVQPQATQEKAAVPPISSPAPPQGPQAQQQPVPAAEVRPEAKELAAASTEQQPSVSAGVDSRSTPSTAQKDQGGEQNQQDEATTDQAADLPQLDDIGMDVNMGGLEDTIPAEIEKQEGNEWVMVDQEGSETGGGMGTADVPTKGDSHGEQAASGEDSNPPAQPTATNAQEQQEQQEQTQSAPQGTGLSTPDFDMGGDFDNVDVDTAGDALASYGDEGDDLNLDNMEDSAFGDAFHPPEDEDMS
ncbi:hypothetical protein PV05_04039 [Exophiala xenobiotica]|uniref:DUF1750-domain-containing protein n=1 Tax=Exophiala xenobiotica TaxID=348802 RepID=A0A0D2EY17_9EURO|nr:uncharacterized protein PV05_04039 [Exophiala xenobiotica]KIW59600.1 hypothetical protein PV05_04039 [Exophiala xenobiotica]